MPDQPIFDMPPLTRNGEGQMRTVGVEIGFAGMGAPFEGDSRFAHPDTAFPGALGSFDASP